MKREWRDIFGVVGVASAVLGAGIYTNMYTKIVPFEETDRNITVHDSYDEISRLLILDSSCDDHRFKQTADFLGADLTCVNSHESHPWARDHYIMGDKMYVPFDTTLSGYSQKYFRAHTLHLLKDVADNHDVTYSGLPFWFEGGQILAMDNYVLLPEMFRSDIVVPFVNIEDVFQDEILFVPNHVEGRGSLLSGHIDMYVTPINNNTVLVGQYAPLGENDLTMLGLGQIENKLDEEIVETLNDTAQFLSDYFTVHRVPFGMVNNGEEDYFISYNNALVSGDKMVVPSFGISLDEVVMDVYDNFGETMPIPSADWIESYSGVHCKMNTLDVR